MSVLKRDEYTLYIDDCIVCMRYIRKGAFISSNRINSTSLLHRLHYEHIYNIKADDHDFTVIVVHIKNLMWDALHIFQRFMQYSYSLMILQHLIENTSKSGITCDKRIIADSHCEQQQQ